MILVSVGTQLPFDRMIRWVDEWAEQVPGLRVIAQVGRSAYTPRALDTKEFVAPAPFRALQQEAEFHVAHAGMGSILTAMELGKQIVVVPRDHLLGEHRNGHQLATARRFRNSAGVHVAMDQSEFIAVLNILRSGGASKTATLNEPVELVTHLRAFIDQEL